MGFGIGVVGFFSAGEGVGGMGGVGIGLCDFEGGDFGSVFG